MDKQMTRDDIVALIEKIVEREGTRAKAATVMGITAAYLGEVLRGTREPGPSILKYFDLERETIYKKK